MNRCPFPVLGHHPFLVTSLGVSILSELDNKYLIFQSIDKSTGDETFWLGEDFCLAFVHVDSANQLSAALGVTEAYTDSMYSLNIEYLILIKIFDCILILNPPLILEEGSMLQFWGCSGGDVDWCRGFKAKVHPVFLIISTVFLIITLFVYLAEDSLRYKNNTFKK